LVSAVVTRKNTDEAQQNNNAKEPDNDDWLFCKRLYNKLLNVPDGPDKDYFKLMTEAEVLRLSYGKSQLPNFPDFVQANTKNYATAYGPSFWNQALSCHILRKLVLHRGLTVLPRRSKWRELVSRHGVTVL
jgi:hypothetical protein